MSRFIVVFVSRPNQSLKIGLADEKFLSLNSDLFCQISKCFHRVYIIYLAERQRTKKPKRKKTEGKGREGRPEAERGTHGSTLGWIRVGQSDSDNSDWWLRDRGKRRTGEYGKSSKDTWRAEKAKYEEELCHYNVLFILQITRGDSSAAISALSQRSYQIILLFDRTAVWTPSQLILMYCVLGFNLIQNHSGWSLKCQLGLIPGIKHTSATGRRFVMNHKAAAAATGVRCSVIVSHHANSSLCWMVAWRIERDYLC